MDDFVNPMSGETPVADGDDQVVPMTMREIKEHEAHIEEHINKLTATKDAEIERLQARCRELHDALLAAHKECGTATVWSEVEAAVARMKAVLDGS